MSRRHVRLLVLSTVIAGVWTGAWSLSLSARQQPTGALDQAILSAYRWRSIGPERGGRSIAISGVKGRSNDGYFGATGGGLWKTTDRGETWTPVTDGQIHSASVGAVAVSESNPDIVFIGMGESCIRGNIMEGDGVYKSTDAGKTWTHLTFPDARVISKIRIHPTNPNIVYVAAFGRLSLPSQDRGIFKSTDGGQTWKRTLFRDEKTGGVDLSIDRNNPNVMYAALWEAFRLEYTMSSGGPGSGLFKSTDAGETWTELTRNPGMPTGLVGKIGVSVSGADSNRVYAIVENENGGLFSSDDAGATWKLVNGGRNIRQRAFYYSHVTADTHNKELVYVLNVGTVRSTDGGKTLTSFVGGDSHEIWVDPDDSNHVLHASDSGGAVTYNALAQQAQFTSRDFATGQFYHVITTKHLPYHVCGAQQDSSTICIPSNTNQGGGGGRGGRGGGAPPVTYSPGGFEPGYIAADPKDPDQFWAGGVNGTFLEWTNRRTGQSREVTPYPLQFSGEPSSALKERIQWTFPIIFSPVDPNVLYTATQHVWKTTNGGQTWDRISADLSRHDPKTMGESGGPITHDMNGPEVYGTVFAIGPGKKDVNVIWAGSDDGLIHVTRNGGRTWTNVTPKEMPEYGRVSIIEASAFDSGAAYAAVKRPLLGDMAPYIFKTRDYGQTWTKIVTGLTPLDYVHTVREDPTRQGLLYAGTQHGVYVSYNDGANWNSISMNLPDAPISDLIVEANDLAISTHGRAFYILDRIGPVRQMDAASAAGDAYLFKPGDAIRSAGGAAIQYVLRKPAQAVRVEVVDAKGAVAWFAESGGTASTSAPAAATGGQGGGGRGGRGGPAGAPLSAGLNTVTWSLQYPSATSFPGMILWGAGVAGPLAAPGTYQVKMTVDGKTQTQPLVVKRHPLYNVTDADLQAQFDFAIQVRDKVSEANNAVIQIRRIKAAIDDRLTKSTDEALKESGGTLKKNLGAVEEQIYQVRNQSGQDPLNFPIKTNNRLASVLSMVNNGDGRPVGNAPVIFKDLVAELKAETDQLSAVLARDLAAFNAIVRRLGLEIVAEK